MKKFEMIGELWLICQEGGGVSDAFDMVALGTGHEVRYGPEGNYLQLPLGAGRVDLADVISEFFDIERLPTTGDRYVGPVRVVIELMR